MSTVRSPWSALAALCLGFFIILVDMTIVAVANPAIMLDLHADMNEVVWVSSAYLLAYAVPLLITGRLGDRFGPKQLYLGGLAIFTAASLWCGLAGSIGVLITARVVQGAGAALMAPQTMAIIGRIFPPDKRGAAMGTWGAVGGVASLVGPLLGGVLINHGGWQWIFYVNVPIGVLAFGFGVRLVPTLPTNSHHFDLPGVALVALGTSALVFGIQQGNSYHWSASVQLCIVGGLVVLGVFLWYQSRIGTEPLVPLGLFRDRNFALGNMVTFALGAAMTAQIVPTYFYLQVVRGLSPTGSALVIAPMAVVSAILSPLVGRLSDKAPPRYLPTFGCALFLLSMVWFIGLMTRNGSVLPILVVSALCGIASACIWAPLTATTLRNLPLQQLGAASGIYNNNRQVGSVLGSAGIGGLVAARMSAHALPVDTSADGGSVGKLPDSVRAGYASALAESLYLTVGFLVLSVVVALFLTNSTKGRL